MNKTKIEIKKIENEVKIFIYQNEELIEYYKEDINKKRLEGNIYLGIVKDVLKGMQSAFIDIGEEKNALIHIKDIIPKQSNVTGNVNIDVEQYQIQKLVKPKEKILVQIKRDCDDKKGSRVTKDIKLTGKYIVLMPFTEFITVSLKIEDKNERDRLIKIVKKYLPKGSGAIIRTSSNSIEEDKIKSDIEELKNLWKKILDEKEKNEKREKPIKIYDNNGLIGKLITDFEPMGLEIVADSEETKKYILNEINQDLKVSVKDVKDMSEMPRKVWLNCGGFITIDKCEALTAIDVNSGRFTGKSELEDTVLKVNLEATKEIARQIKLRDIGGIIIIDYIDMEKEKDRNKVKETMLEEIKNDRSKVQVLEFTKLGLLEMTRKHILGR